MIESSRMATNGPCSETDLSTVEDDAALSLIFFLLVAGLFPLKLKANNGHWSSVNLLNTFQVHQTKELIHQLILIKMYLLYLL